MGSNFIITVNDLHITLHGRFSEINDNQEAGKTTESRLTLAQLYSQTANDKNNAFLATRNSSLRTLNIVYIFEVLK